MTRPTARVLALLEVLQSGGTRTLGELAGRLDVDERTVRRYVEHLRDLDVPVQSVRGRHGGYRLARGYRLPPIMLTDEEALAVTLGLLAAERAGPVGAPVAARSAAAKLRRVLPETLARRLDALVTTVDVTVPARPDVAPEARILLLLAGAARDHRPVAITYTGRDGRSSERTLHPYGIVVHGGRWYTTGEDSASGEVRTFRLDRISGPAVRAGSFDVPAGFDATGHVTAALAGTPWRHAVSVRVEGPAAEVRPRLPPGLATVDELPDGAARVRLRAERLDWVPAVLVGLGRPFVVEHPEALRDEIRALAARLHDSVAVLSGDT